MPCATLYGWWNTMLCIGSTEEYVSGYQIRAVLFWELSFLPLLLTHALSIQQNHCFVFSHAWQRKTKHTGLYSYNTTLKAMKPLEELFFSSFLSNVRNFLYRTWQNLRGKKRNQGKVISELWPYSVNLYNWSLWKWVPVEEWFILFSLCTIGLYIKVHRFVFI